MEQLPALSTVLCAVLLIPTWGAGLTVRQSPVVRAYVGETATLICSFEYRWGSMVNVWWTRAPGVVLESHHPFCSGRLNVSFQDLFWKGEVTLTLSELEKRDSGLYRCHVSIRQGESGTGVGTELLVVERNQIDTGLTVLQSPAVLRASPGETVNLSCSFENRQGSVAKASWTRAPGVVLESHHPFYKGRLNVSDLDLLRKGEATLTLSELEKRDSGLYQCHISNRQGESGTGAGTKLQVTGRNQSDTGKEPAPVGCCSWELLYQVTIALGLLLILGLVATLLLKRC
ncbi:CD276 antigen-like [Caretta caretta]|uniref:CD276 antigen-like n=1 Tax=Caretta caretta TaxID=8467 RepID=UPI003F4B621F